MMITDRLDKIRELLMVAMIDLNSDDELAEDLIDWSIIDRTVICLRAMERMEPYRTVAGERILAQARSMAVRAQTLLRQRTIVPEVFEGRVDPKGLVAPAVMAGRGIFGYEK